jgi:hypothetical protein
MRSERARRQCSARASTATVDDFSLMRVFGIQALPFDEMESATQLLVARTILLNLAERWSNRFQS